MVMLMSVRVNFGHHVANPNRKLTQTVHSILSIEIHCYHDLDVAIA